MDRNLGATSATPGDVELLGLMYQWGRKDPFPGSSAINPSSNNAPPAKSTIDWPSSVETSEANGTVDFVTKHPTTFLTANQNPGDWLMPQNDNLWSSDKTQYDPCPPGWRVSEPSAWEFLISGAFSGYTTYDEDARTYEMPMEEPRCFYPSTGYRYGDNISFISTDGFLWTCNHYLQLKFYVSKIEPWYHNYFIDQEGYRYFGYAVRCQMIE